jgi:hypothetical protein
MCKVYNTIGSLTSIKHHLDRHKINDFKSLKDVINFQNSCLTLRQEIVSLYENLVEQEKNMLQIDLEQLDKEIEKQKLQLEKELNNKIDKLKEQLTILAASHPKNYFKRLTKYLTALYYIKKINHNESNLDLKVQKSIKELVTLHQDKNTRYQYIISHFDDAVKQSYKHPLAELERKKAIIDDLSPLIYGALGEQKVVKTLESLPDEYFLINDFSISFSAPIYNRQENDYIKSIQIDHILIAPSGISSVRLR